MTRQEKPSPGRSRALRAERREVEAEIFGEPHRRGGDRSRKAGEEGGPAAQERRERAVGFAQIRIFASGAREAGPELRIAERPRERENPSYDPNPYQQPRICETFCQQPGGRKDPDPDDVGYDNGGGEGRTHRSREFGA